tara:strand:- start:1087 stop:1707 length:621 start_codon:yes stop_codon:yes gene_type:complete
MVYKNLFNRLFFSIFFLILYLIVLNNIYLLFLLGTFIYLFIFYEVIKYFKIFFRLIIFYLFFSYFCFTFYILNFFDFITFNVFIFTIILFDSFSFFTGKIFGKKYMFKYLSPKKTLEGYLGGILLTNLSLISAFYLISIQIQFFSLILLINLTVFFSIFGDLIESYFKRANNMKDSSSFLPGHGGYFDRFDSFVASIIILNIFNLL